jgi:hypothetical protein
VLFQAYIQYIPTAQSNDYSGIVVAISRLAGDNKQRRYHITSYYLVSKLFTAAKEGHRPVLSTVHSWSSGYWRYDGTSSPHDEVESVPTLSSSRNAWRNGVAFVNHEQFQRIGTQSSYDLGFRRLHVTKTITLRCPFDHYANREVITGDWRR